MESPHHYVQEAAAALAEIRVDTSVIRRLSQPERAFTRFHARSDADFGDADYTGAL